MELDEKIRAAALQLGQALRQDERVQAYLDALKETQSDSEASTLKRKCMRYMKSWSPANKFVNNPTRS